MIASVRRGALREETGASSRGSAWRVAVLGGGRRGQVLALQRMAAISTQVVWG